MTSKADGDTASTGHGSGRRQASGTAQPISFAEVLSAEEAALHSAFPDDDKNERLGIALSGGGVRSASFTTGVLQFLARQPALVRKLRWVSMVSGGGFAGSSAAALMLAGAQSQVSPLDTIDLESADRAKAATQEAAENRIINAIRENSSYLTPGRTFGRRGRASLLAHYLFGLAFNLTEVLAVLLASLGLAALAVQFALAPRDAETVRWAATICTLAAALGWELRHSWPYWRSKGLRGVHRGIVDKRYAWLLVAAALSLLASVWPEEISTTEGEWIVALLVVQSLVAALAGERLRRRQPQPPEAPQSTPAPVGFSRRLGTWSLILATLALAIDDMRVPDGTRCPPDPWTSLLMPLQLGLKCTEPGVLPEDMELTVAFVASRWMRVAACLALIGALRPGPRGRLALSIVAVLGLAMSVAWMRWLGDAGPRLGIGFVATFCLGLSLALGERKAPFDASKALEGASTRIILGSYVVVGCVALQALHFWRDRILSETNAITQRVAPGVTHLEGQTEGALAALVVGAMLYAFTFVTRSAWARGLSSPHHQYRQALKEAFLDAPLHAMGGKRDQDDAEPASLTLPCMTVKELRPASAARLPLFIWNMAANLRQDTATGAADRRKVSRFEVTPLAAGYSNRRCMLDNTNSKASSWFAKMTVEKAMAISGAAVSPRMGFYSQGWLWTLTTVLNLRLGARAPDPLEGTTGFPTFLPTPVGFLSKWLPAHKQVYLTDGGHYDNSGILALIARRVPFIVAIDAEKDGAAGFKAMADAVRLARTDHRAHVRIDVSGLAPDGQGFARAACAVGTIEYEADARGEAFVGRILYIKAVLRGDEPVDVRHYRANHPAFPHEPTGNQFFTEAQFDAYRELGFHVARRAFKPLTWNWAAEKKEERSRTLPDTEELSDIFDTLWFAWNDSRSCTPEQFVSLTEEWSRLVAGGIPESPGASTATSSAASTSSSKQQVVRRAGGVGQPASVDSLTAVSKVDRTASQASEQNIALRWIQFCEQVFVVTRLWQNIDAPDNAGWLHSIKHAFQRPDVEREWRHPESKQLFGEDFQHFIDQEIVPRGTLVGRSAWFVLRMTRVSQPRPPLMRTSPVLLNSGVTFLVWLAATRSHAFVRMTETQESRNARNL
jgi:hypothetical protein